MELECRGKVRSAIAALKPEWQDRLGPDTLLDISLFRQLADTALTSDMPIEQEGEARTGAALHGEQHPQHLRAGP